MTHPFVQRLDSEASCTLGNGIRRFTGLPSALSISRDQRDADRHFMDHLSAETQPWQTALWKTAS